MIKRIARILFFVVLWSAVVGYIVYASVITSRHRAMQVVERVNIAVTDSTDMGQLVTSQKVREWILRSGIATIGSPIDKIDVAGIRHAVERNGFVSRVDVCVSYSGVLSIAVSQRRPMMRLMTDGYNVYVTEQGFVFASPESSSLYVPVVTGSYRPPVPPSYEGLAADYVAGVLARYDDDIKRIGREKRPLYAREDSLRAIRREVRRMRLDKVWFETEDEHIGRVEELRTAKKQRMRYYDGLLRDVGRSIDAVSARQEVVAQKRKKTEERYADFLKLINFVGWLESDSFWSSEVVQIIASDGVSGAIELEIVPRSGDFRILLGELGETDVMQRRFDKLFRFYRDGLGRIGWDKFRKIDVRYNNQVVCTE